MRLDLACLVTGLAGTGLFLGGCSVSTSSVALASGPVPVRLSTTPAIAPYGGSRQVSVTSPNADSIQLRSANGLDRYSAAGSALQVSLPGNFGDDAPQNRFALRSHGRLLNVLKQPLDVLVCRNQICRSYYHELAVQLPERNRRRIAVTGSWSTASTTRAFGGTDLPVSRRARSRSEWNLQAEWAAGAVNARLQGFAGPDRRGASLDIAREIKRGDAVSYGLSVHLEGVQPDWPLAGGISAPSSGNAYRVSLGPAVMLKGITASSQLGIYADGRQIMQELSTFLSINGGLTEVRLPLTVTLDKTFAFGDQSILPRRQEQVERLTLAWEFLPSLALRLRIASRRSTWPTGQEASRLYANEAAYSLGAQYTVGW